MIGRPTLLPLRYDLGMYIRVNHRNSVAIIVHAEGVAAVPGKNAFALRPEAR